MVRPAWVMPERELLQTTFSDVLTKELLDQEYDHSEGSLTSVIIRIVEDPIGFSVLRSRPSSKAHFFEVLGPVLSIEAQTQIGKNMDGFDALVRAPVSGHFLAERTFEIWLEALIQILIETQIRIQEAFLYSTQIPSKCSWHQAASSPPLSPVHLKSLPQYDGLGDEVHPGNRIIQVHLQGPSLTAAWDRNTTIVDQASNANIKKLEDHLSLGQNETPHQSGSAYIYHSTLSHMVYPRWADKWSGDDIDLMGKDNATQMNPVGVPGAYTGFSAFQCFLWSAFREALFEDVPRKSTVRKMNRKWISNGVTFTGIPVFVFHKSYPSPGSECTSFILSKQCVQLFKERVTNLNESSPSGKGWDPDQAWNKLRSVHKSDIDKWPSVLHCYEDDLQRQFLNEAPVNLWRSLWVGNGIDRLNRSYKFTIVISFEETPSLPPLIASSDQTPQGEKEDDEDDKRRSRNKKHRVRRGLGLVKRVSELFLPA